MLTYIYKKYIFFLIFIFLQPAFAQQSFYLSADKIIKNDKDKLILAQGNVEIQSGKIKTQSDTLKFDTEKNQIILEGNIRILGQQGEIIFAEKAILDYRNKEVNRDRNALFVFNDLQLLTVISYVFRCLPMTPNDST